MNGTIHETVHGTQVSICDTCEERDPTFNWVPVFHYRGGGYGKVREANVPIGPCSHPLHADTPPSPRLLAAEKRFLAARKAEVDGFTKPASEWRKLQAASREAEAAMNAVFDAEAAAA